MNSLDPLDKVLDKSLEKRRAATTARRPCCIGRDYVHRRMARGWYLGWVVQVPVLQTRDLSWKSAHDLVDFEVQSRTILSHPCKFSPRVPTTIFVARGLWVTCSNKRTTEFKCDSAAGAIFIRGLLAIAPNTIYHEHSL